MKIQLTPINVGWVELLTFATQKDVQLVRELDLPNEEMWDLMNMTLIQIDKVLRQKMREDISQSAKAYLDIFNKK